MELRECSLCGRQMPKYEGIDHIIDKHTGLISNLVDGLLVELDENDK